MTTAAEQARDVGMEQALRAERVQAWKVRADEWLEAFPFGPPFSVSDLGFTADDLVAVIGLPDAGPSRNNVVGAMFSTWSRAGRIEWTGRFDKSERVEGHGNLQRVWRRTSLEGSELGTASGGSDPSSDRVEAGPAAVASSGTRSLAPDGNLSGKTSEPCGAEQGGDIPPRAESAGVGGLPSERDQATAFSAPECDGGRARSLSEQQLSFWSRAA